MHVGRCGEAVHDRGVDREGIGLSCIPKAPDQGGRAKDHPPSILRAAATQCYEALLTTVLVKPKKHPAFTACKPYEPGNIHAPGSQVENKIL